MSFDQNGVGSLNVFCLMPNTPGRELAEPNVQGLFVPLTNITRELGGKIGTCFLNGIVEMKTLCPNLGIGRESGGRQGHSGNLSPGGGKIFLGNWNPKGKT